MIMDIIVLKGSLLSGLFASLASCFGKIGTTEALCSQIVDCFLGETRSSGLETIGDIDNYRQYSIWTVQALAIGAMIASNGLMWSQFSLALAYTKFTIQVTAINTVTNFIVTALIGATLFSETISFQWCIGISAILFGIVLLKQKEDTEDSLKPLEEIQKKTKSKIN